MTKKRVALLLANEKNSYQQLLVKSAQEKAAGLGIEILPPFFAEGMSIKQINQFFDSISGDNPPDGITLTR